MKKTVLCLALAFSLFACQEEKRKVTADMINFPQTASSNADEVDMPKISFDSTTCNFGTIAIGEKVVHSFKFKNTGNAPLVISQVIPSCGCTTLKDWPKDPIYPGEGGSITAEFNSTGFPGVISKSITVGTNCLPGDWYLKLEGTVAGNEKIEEVKPPIQMERTR